MKTTLILLTALLAGITLPCFSAQNSETTELPKARVLFAYNNLAITELMNTPYWEPDRTREEAIAYIENKTISDITNSNLVLKNSQIDTFEWEIADIVEIPTQFPPRGSMHDDGDFLQNNPDAKEFILNAAGTAAADQIFVFSTMGTDSVGGWASTLTSEYPISFGAVSRDYTNVAHEMGHNLQANHSRDLLDTANQNRGPEAYNFGHMIAPNNHDSLLSNSFIFEPPPNTGGSEAARIGTIMSYGNDLPYFSNPNLQVTATAVEFVQKHPDGRGDWEPTGTYTFQLGVPQGVPDAPDVENAFRVYRETGDYSLLSTTTGSYGAADNARVLRQTGPILAAMHGEMETPRIISSTISYEPGDFQTLDGIYGPGYLKAIVVASGENLKATWTQSGSQRTKRAEDGMDTYSVYFLPYPWIPYATSTTGIPGRDTFIFRSNNTTQPVAVTISNPLGSDSLILTPTFSGTTTGTTTGTSSGTGGGNTGGNTGGNNTGGSNSSGGGGGGAPSSWMLLGLAILAACRGNKKTDSP